MTAAAVPAQKRVRRSPAFFRVPVAIELLLLTLLGYEVVRQNASHRAQTAGWAKVELLGIAPTAALLGVFGVALFVRSQYALVTTPALAGHGDGWVAHDGVKVWTLRIHNAGGGLARVQQVRYRLAVGAELPVSRDATVANEYLNHAVPVSHDLRFLRDVSPGFPFKSQTDMDKSLPLLAIDAESASRISCLEVEIRFTDPLGDEYSWTKNLTQVLRSAPNP